MFIVGIIEPDKLGLSPREVLGIELADISSAAEHPAEEFA